MRIRIQGLQECGTGSETIEREDYRRGSARESYLSDIKNRNVIQGVCPHLVDVGDHFDPTLLLDEAIGGLRAAQDLLVLRLPHDLVDVDLVRGFHWWRPKT